jgi:single-strand DNA-binding protein
VTASIAVHSSYKQGEAYNERTDWFRLVAFGEAGEALNRFGKGERVRVVGRLQSSSYTDREGKQRTSVELVVLHSEPAPLPRKSDDATVEP